MKMKYLALSSNLKKNSTEKHPPYLFKFQILTTRTEETDKALRMKIRTLYVIHDKFWVTTHYDV